MRELDLDKLEKISSLKLSPQPKTSATDLKMRKPTYDVSSPRATNISHGLVEYSSPGNFS